MRWVDTNVFIRLLTQDDPAKAEASGRFFTSLDAGQDEAATSEMVVGEVVYVLSARGHYGMSREGIRDRLARMLESQGLRIAGKEVLLRALDFYVAYPRLDFEDALSVAHMEARGISDIVSYDRGFDAVDGVTRIEP
ncbi:MAG TPA: type II toxin-antitoxin system VapC family toxin [Dehalococcoidia bacterium]|nr:type II toxin-antitoxin system VapC family toxin [Dehalococcoidia bacterium]